MLGHITEPARALLSLWLPKALFLAQHSFLIAMCQCIPLHLYSAEHNGALISVGLYALL